MHRFDRLVELALPQHGVVTLAQLREAGWAGTTITRWVRSALLSRIGQGVYLVEGLPFTYRTACMAAVIRPVPVSYICRRSAAVLHGWLEPTVASRRPEADGACSAGRENGDVELDLQLEPTTDAGGGAGRVSALQTEDMPLALPRVGPPVEVVRPTKSSGRPRSGEIVHRSLHLPEHHRSKVDGIGVTSRPRTLVDLSTEVGETMLTRWVKQALRTQTCSLALLRAVALELAPHRPGAPRFRAVLAAVTADEGVADTDLSALARRLFERAGLRPRWEAHVSGPDGYIGRVDSLFEFERVVVEYDSSRYHDDLDDAVRDRRLVDAGYLVLRASGFDLTVRSQAFLAELMALLAARRPRSTSAA